MSSTNASPTPIEIEKRILILRGQRVMIDSDLAALYGVQTKRLNEQVKRNASRFPSDFMFVLNAVEKDEVVANCDHLAKLKFSKTLPFAFTEHGAIQAANVLASPQAIEMGIYVVRAFIKMREILVSNSEFLHRLNELESKTDLLELQHETFAHNTRIQLRQLIETLRELSVQPEQVKKRSIGFVNNEQSTK
ncbi:ORF6N domain-containing protein [Undibacterium cyanobacteriorum]|uniref:ORF6N domain-containing protein n=1 Tax=Undibacterium cyanobacteriorum TaxID=3073561 RepID=A0ABY9RGB8_9BURK|nr:ORF6N domain-containing protein [Undibacterium sp. 20NA77.5]WMW79330.1 ORF6N domain-containing protein [Undibacterium sp. 20NA77.5]